MPEGSKNMKEQQPRVALTGIGLAVGISLGGAAALEGCAPQQPPQAQAQVRETQPVSAQPPSTPEARIVMPVGRASAPAVVPAVTPEPPKQLTATPTLEPTATPKPEPTKEVKKEVPCQILPTEFCAQGERVMINIAGTQYEHLAFRLPNVPNGIPVYSPVDGFLTYGREGGPQSPPVRFAVRMAGGAADIRGNLRLENIVDGRNITAGTVIGYTTGKKILGDHDLLFTITKKTPNGLVIDEDALRKLFPAAFEKPISPIKQDGPAKPTITMLFSPNLPQ